MGTECRTCKRTSRSTPTGNVNPKFILRCFRKASGILIHPPRRPCPNLIFFLLPLPRIRYTFNRSTNGIPASSLKRRCSSTSIYITVVPASAMPILGRRKRTIPVSTSRIRIRDPFTTLKDRGNLRERQGHGMFIRSTRQSRQGVGFGRSIGPFSQRSSSTLTSAQVPKLPMAGMFRGAKTPNNSPITMIVGVSGSSLSGRGMVTGGSGRNSHHGGSSKGDIAQPTHGDKSITVIQIMKWERYGGGGRTRVATSLHAKR